MGGVALLILAFRQINFSDLTNGLQRVNFWWLLAAKVMVTVAHLTRAFRWRLLINPLGYRPRLISTFFAMMTGYFANIATPKMGEFVRCLSLQRTESVPTSSSVGTVIVERSIDILSVLIVFGLAFWLHVSLIDVFVKQKIIDPLINQTWAFTGNEIYLALGFATIAAGIIIMVLIHQHRKGKYMGLFAYPLSMIRKIIHGILSITKMRQRVLFFLLTLLMWVFYLFGFYMNFFAFDTTDHFGLTSGLLVFAFSAIGWAVPIHGGIGAYHWIVSQGLVLLGLSFEDGLTFATIVHATGILYNLIVGSISVIFILFIKLDGNPFAWLKGRFDILTSGRSLND